MGNKIDMEHERKVSCQEAQDLAKSYKIEYFEASAMTGVGIKESFSHVIDKCLDDIIGLRALA